MNRKRIAIHEAGHLVMALILDLEVLGCDISRKKARYPGELGKCMVFDPDPVGIRKFLLSMGGIMAENHFFSDDKGGLKDRKDAFELLRRYLNHYNRMPQYDSLKPVLEEASRVFHSSPALEMVDNASRLLIKEVSIGPAEIEPLRKRTRDSIDKSRLLEMIDALTEPETPLDWKAVGLELLDKGRTLLKKIREM
ncbi:MAG: hypothetical protein JW971_00020 [Synergistales bacterium]|nr:hypothetical protein [Synergistales bacterium]